MSQDIGDGRSVEHVSRLGVEVITGKPATPTTQGKNERFHQRMDGQFEG